MYKTKNSLPENVRGQAIGLLSRNLALAIDLKLQTKQAHWNVKGPNFIALHELFDSIATLADGFVDLIAERITTLGGTAEGTLQAVAKNSTLSAYPLNITTGNAHLEALSGALAAFGAKIVMRRSAPPLNMSNMPSTPPPCCWKICASTVGSMPGSGM